MRAIWVPVAGLLALGVLAWLSIRVYPPRIEADVAARASAALSASGLAFATVSADGRDVRLTGTAPGELERAQATRVASSVPGVRLVNNDLAVGGPAPAPAPETPSGPSPEDDDAGQVAASSEAGADPAPPVTPGERDVGPKPARPWQTRFRYDGVSLALGGDAPGRAFRESVAGRVPDAFGDVALEDTLTERADPAAGADELLLTALVELAEFQTGTVELKDKTLRVSGRLRAGEDVDDLQSRLTAALPAGHRLAFDVNAAPPAGAGAACQSAFDALLEGERIEFAFNSAALAPAAHALLDELARIAAECPDTRVRVTGHTDDRGDPAYNLELSRERARSVVAYLTDNGVDPGRLEAEGLGEARPLASNASAEGRARNRRIEFRVLEGDS